jgi:hypothetical protein
MQTAVASVVAFRSHVGRLAVPVQVLLSKSSALIRASSSLSSML